jgi:hypothetical protein
MDANISLARFCRSIDRFLKLETPFSHMTMAIILMLL